MGGAASGANADAKTGVGTHVLPSDHINVAFTDRNSFNDIHAVADGYLIEITYDAGRWLNSDGTWQDDYSLLFQISKKQFVMITHPTRLSPELQAIVGTLHPGSNNYFQVSVTGGEVLRASDGNPYLGIFDLIAYDLTYSPPGYFATRLYKVPPTSENPIALYAEPLRSQPTAKLPERAEPRAGQYYYDVAGKLVGSWSADEPMSQKKVTTFFYDCRDPSQVRISDTETGMVYAVKGNAPDPASIT
jgi:hypothetical protein